MWQKENLIRKLGARHIANFGSSKELILTGKIRKIKRWLGLCLTQDEPFGMF